MTTQTKTFIELSDIIGLRLECKSCGCSLALGSTKGRETVDSLLSMGNKTLLNCPTCGAAWMQTLDPNRLADTALKELVRKLSDFKKIEHNYGCSVALEIKPEEDSEESKEA
jgi:hypothetical protein